MAILRLPKEINDVKTTAAASVVRWLSSRSSSSSSASMNENENYYWMYEIPDNESQVKAASPCYDSYRIWDTTTTQSNHGEVVGSNAWENDNHHQYLWYQQQQQCPCSYRNYSLFYRILYWCKQIILKVGRSYYALPMALLLFTLGMGILIGYLIGYRRGRYHHDHQHQPPQFRSKETSKSKIYAGAILPSLVQLYMYVCHALGRIQIGHFFLSCTRQKRSQSSLERMVSDNQEQLNDCSMPSTGKRLVIDRPSIPTNDDCSSAAIDHKELVARVELKSDNETQCESGLSRQELPKHIAVVMDGNRRYGLQQYNDPILGHWDGSKKLVQFVKWCVVEQIQELTVYAFSTENWSRSAHEVSALMNIIIKHCEELRIEAIAKQISIHIKSTDIESIPVNVREVLYQLEKDTNQNNPTLRMNICLSYGSRGEIVQACRSIVTEYQSGNWTSLLQVTEDSITQKLLVGSSPYPSLVRKDTTTRDNSHSHPPDIFIRTSGEIRLSNFLLWQMAYTELFFLDKNWPELNKDDFLNVLRSYAHCRQRRFGR
jgi:undecaprenyl diphosphate synthase